MAPQLCGHETAAIIFVMKPRILIKKCESLFKNFLGQDSLICDDVGWWSGFNKGDDSIYDVDIRLHNIVEVMGSDNQVYTSHGAPIDSSIIAFDGGRIF